MDLVHILGVGPAKPTSLGKSAFTAGPVLVAFGGGNTALTWTPAVDAALKETGVLLRAEPDTDTADAVSAMILKSITASSIYHREQVE